MTATLVAEKEAIETLADLVDRLGEIPLKGGPALPGFTRSLSDWFAELDRRGK